MTVPEAFGHWPNHYSLGPRTRQRFAGADLGTYA